MKNDIDIDSSVRDLENLSQKSIQKPKTSSTKQINSPPREKNHITELKKKFSNSVKKELVKQQIFDTEKNIKAAISIADEQKEDEVDCEEIEYEEEMLGKRSSAAVDALSDFVYNDLHSFLTEVKKMTVKLDRVPKKLSVEMINGVLDFVNSHVGKLKAQQQEEKYI